jgi:hypothetical protein
MDHPQSMVLTEKDFIDFMIFLNKENETTVLPLFLRRALYGSSLLLFGYTLDDLNFRSIFHSGLISFMCSFTRNKNSFAVMEVPSKENNDLLEIDREKVKKYTEKYAVNVFKMRIHWSYIREFMQELRKTLDKGTR